MKHYGDITKINGAAVEPVNVIIGGSPCQDLSVAGKQKGIKHTDNGDDETTRSGLFMEQLRIIKEMRRNDIEHGRTGIYTRPRFMVWENVPGAFSSNKGADFGAVLEETLKVVCEKAPAVPIPKHGWPNAGCLTDVAGKWSVAWRVFDAQFWGVPQRRKRIALVADFGGLAAPEILFERKGVCGNIEPCGPSREDTPAETARGIGAAVRAFCFQGNGIDRADTAGCNGKGWTEGVSYTLNTIDRPAVAVIPIDMRNATRNTAAGDTCGGIGEIGDPTFTITADYSHAVALENHPQDSLIKINESGVVQTLASNMGMGGNNVPLVMEAQNNLNVAAPTDPPAITATCGSFIQTATEVSSTLLARDYKDPQIVCCPIIRRQSMVYRESSFGTYAEGNFGTLKACGGNNGGGSESLIVLNDQGGSSMNIEKDCISPTLRAESHNNEPIVFHAMQDPITSETVTPCLSSGSPNGQAAIGVSVDYAVRRLTPLECERLQGYPDGWTDIGEWADTNGKTHAESADSARYKAIGNSIALPPWAYVLQRLSVCCGDDITMASLFDGIGGFPLIWERLNGAGTCLWASEIEEFPIAVTTQRFNEEA